MEVHAPKGVHSVGSHAASNQDFIPFQGEGHSLRDTHAESWEHLQQTHQAHRMVDREEQSPQYDETQGQQERQAVMNSVFGQNPVS